MYNTWVVEPLGCEPSPRTATDCAVGRGGIYDHGRSTTWREVGNYSTTVEGYLSPKLEAQATFGLDTVSLGDGNFTGLPPLQSQVVAAVTDVTYYNGIFGLNPQASNYTTLNNFQPSFLSSLKSKNLIPSLSWGYTVGASYRKREIPGFIVR